MKGLTSRPEFIVWMAVVVGLVAVVVYGLIVVGRGRLIVPPTPTPTATLAATATPMPTPLPHLSKLSKHEAERLVAERMTAQPLPEGCAYDKPEMIAPSKVLAEGSDPQVVVNIIWYYRVMGRPLCGAAVTWLFDTEEEANEKLKVLSSYLSNEPPCYSEKSCFAEIVVKTGRWVIWVMTYGESELEAKENLSHWLSGYLWEIIKAGG